MAQVAIVTAPFSRSTIDARRQLLTCLLTWTPLSRTDLARRTGMNKPTVSNLVARMIEDGTVVELGSGASSGGRKPTLLTVRAESHFAIGIEIDPERIQAVLVDLRGAIVATTERAVDALSIPVVLDTVEELARAFALTIDSSLVLGCGLAVPGIVDSAHGVVQSRERLGWSDLPLQSLLEDRLEMPVFITDRGKAAGLGELWNLGRSRPGDSIYLYLGSGVAGAFVLGGELHWGVGGVAGEVGHMTVDPAGPRCNCGNDGCLEALVSTSSILERHRRLGGEQISIAEVGVAAATGDPIAVQVVNETSRWLGIAIANLVNALNPAVVVLGGPTAVWGEVLIEGTRREMNRRILPLLRPSVKLVIGRARAMAPSLGAAAMVLHEAAGLIARAASVESPREAVV